MEARTLAEVHGLEQAEFIERLLSEYADMRNLEPISSSQHHHALGPSIPIVVGAGISASAGVPMNFELLTHIRAKLQLPDTANYADIYEKLSLSMKKRSNVSNTELKIALRKQFESCGIHRDDGKLYPNISNIAAVHLLRNGLLGPIVSLNVDPLLAVATRVTATEDSCEVRSVVNISQFSDYVHADTQKRSNLPLILQPHGTIEEPLSLRFLHDELLDQEDAIFRAVLESLHWYEL
jgi:hypothetical protein